ncbi:MAG: 2-amino-4-oxopentanoate thiolase subunit OrtB [Candidatus Wallbacteria bacterium]|nr:2-amino-4-oxopentanoate thiolase subunit OrtB [Candidatus Wallbacteria bacterium]
MKDRSYQAVTARKNEIMKASMGIDYDEFIITPIAFDYEKMMHKAGYPLDEIFSIQRQTKVADTPLFELTGITKELRKHCAPGMGARIFLKDEAANASGSFKARRASVSVFEAQKRGYAGVVAATSGNYGAAVASQAAQRGLKCIILQEVFDSRGMGQPEILEKGRKCEAYGAEVLQLSVGPELFYYLLLTLEETGFFNASLYTPFGIAGVETLGYELVEQVRSRIGKDPDVVMVTHAGGGNVTGTARGVAKAGAVNVKIHGASVDLSGLHMASDRDFNRKSFTTGHTGFGIPFATWPDRVDVPRNAARPLRYLDGYHLVSQGEVFFVTQLLAVLEGIERGPAGNTSLAAAISMARDMRDDQVIVVQETEYTGAGKHPTAQLSFARNNGIIVRTGDPADNKPGEVIVIPEHLGQIRAREYPLSELRSSYLKNVLRIFPDYVFTEKDYAFLAEELRMSVEGVTREMASLASHL